MIKFIKGVVFLPSILLVLPYIIYVYVEVIRNTNIIDLELMGDKEVVKGALKIITPFIEDNMQYLRLISILTWIVLVFNYYI